MKLRDRGMTADWQVYPNTRWNYALIVDPDDPAKSIGETETALGDAPFTRSGAPVKLSVKARKLNSWRAVDGVAEPLPESPVASDESVESITLIPYAAPKLRITAFRNPRVRLGLPQGTLRSGFRNRDDCRRGT